MDLPCHALQLYQVTSSMRQYNFKVCGFRNPLQNDTALHIKDRKHAQGSSCKQHAPSRYFHMELRNARNNKSLRL